MIEVVEPRLLIGKWGEEGRRSKLRKAQTISMAKPNITFR